MPVLQEVMGLLAFPADTNIKPYKDMMHTSRWQALIKQFRLVVRSVKGPYDRLMVRSVTGLS